jgi:hypothetical protein
VGCVLPCCVHPSFALGAVLWCLLWHHVCWLLMLLSVRPAATGMGAAHVVAHFGCRAIVFLRGCPLRCLFVPGASPPPATEAPALVLKPVCTVTLQTGVSTSAGASVAGGGAPQQAPRHRRRPASRPLGHHQPAEREPSTGITRTTACQEQINTTARAWQAQCRTSTRDQEETQGEQVRPASLLCVDVRGG